MSQENDLFVWNETPGFYDQHWRGMPEFNQPDKGAHRQIIVSFESDEDVEAFSKLIGQNITKKTKSLWYPQHERQSVRDLFWVEEE